MFSGTELLLYLIMILSSAFYALSAPFLPIMFEEKGIRLEWVGIVFASFSIALIVFSPLVSNMIDCCGQPNLLGLGLIIMGASTLAFGYTKELEDNRHVIYLSLALRFIQGKIQTPVNSLTCHKLY